MIRAILFDLGGVLERVEAAPRVEAWTGGAIPASEFWHRWLSAKSVESFERGLIGEAEFGERAVPELGLSISVPAFLADFRTWLSGPLPGAADLVAEVRRAGLALASFSNSNEVHWPIMESHQATSARFDRNFPSHRLGLCKPSPEAFREVVSRWDFAAHEILFLDDNEINCEGAREAGLRATRVVGPDQARRALVEQGLLS